ncbi:hypothetical protein ID866_9652 [Astraeus odoratus]|nr:hypothetical protein ID866_9652 [Astraeus odoratus]
MSFLRGFRHNFFRRCIVISCSSGNQYFEFPTLDGVCLFVTHIFRLCSLSLLSIAQAVQNVQYNTAAAVMCWLMWLVGDAYLVRNFFQVMISAESYVPNDPIELTCHGCSAMVRLANSYTTRPANHREAKEREEHAGIAAAKVPPPSYSVKQPDLENAR